MADADDGGAAMTGSPYVTEEPLTLEGIGQYMQKIYAKEESRLRQNPEMRRRKGGCGDRRKS
jgi:hypothetical protein